MAGATGRYTQYSAKFWYSDSDPGDVINLQQLRQTSLRQNATIAERQLQGVVDVSQRTLVSAEPMQQFVTDDLTNVFQNIPIGGIKIEDKASFWTIERDEAGTFRTTGQQYDSPYGGFLYMDSLRASQDDQGGATATLNYYALSDDGLNIPLVMYGASHTGAPVPAMNSWYFLGPVYWGQDSADDTENVLLDGLTSWAYESGVQYSARPFQGHLFGVKGSVTRRRQRIVLTTTDEGALYDQLANLFLTSVVPPTEVGDMAIRCYLRRAVACGTRIADGTGSHLMLRAQLACANVDELQWSENEDGTHSVNILLAGNPTIHQSQTIAL